MGPATLSIGRLAELRRAPATGGLKLAQGREAGQNRKMAMESKRVEVLGMGLQATDYAGGVKLLEELAQREKPGMVAACNTHLVALARHRPDYGRVLAEFDLLLPDGMPLIWSMRRKGADLKDRVYGPYFMLEALKKLPRPWKHFFFWRNGKLSVGVVGGSTSGSTQCGDCGNSLSAVSGMDGKR